MALKQKDREALKDWEAHKRSIEQATVIDTDEDYATKKARIDHLLKDGNEVEFFKYYFPHYCKSEFGSFHIRFFKYLIKNDRAYMVLKWGRAHAKSVTVLLAVLYLKFKKKYKNFLLASNNETKAIELITPLRLEFEKNQRLINDFGTQVNPGNWTAEKFVTLDGFSYRAIGAGQSPRGTRDEEARPDFIATDDIDIEEVCRNPKRLDELWEWVMGALFGCFDITGSKRFLIAGNQIGKDCIVSRAIEEADYFEQVDILKKETYDPVFVEQLKKQVEQFPNKSHKDYQVWLECVKYAEAGYKPSWKERFTLFDCVYMIKKMGYRMSQREYFNNPILEGKVFKKDWMQYKKLPLLRHYVNLVAYLDPGFKKTATSDSKCVILLGMISGEIHVRKVYCGKATVEEMIEWCYGIHEYVKRGNGVYRLKMEEVFLQSLLYKDFAVAGAKKYPLPVSGDTRKKPDKDARIEALSGYFERGAVYIDEDIKEDHHLQALIEQFLSFEPGVKTLKDGPDAFEGAVHYLQIGGPPQQEDLESGTYSRSKHKL